MSQEEFDALMPVEFWREVVDRVAVEVPGTLLLAEAFWMLEGYFVRTLGMHRVYNSAFMNMLRDEENAKYRSYLKKTIEFDPDILKRYVNFMSNPDERTAIDQFGTGDKCFGVATVMATMPGLPMFGHGQIEGYTERYGMEFKAARMDERPNESLVARHQHEIAPLLKRRHIFAESANFVLYDFWTDHGSVDENVFAYSNHSGGQRSIVLYNNTYGATRGTIHISAASMDKGSGELRQRSLSDGLGIGDEDNLILAYRDHTRGLEYLRRASDLRNNGLPFDLRGYQYAVLLDWRELRSTAEQPWDRLCDGLNGGGVYSVDEALQMLRSRPLHEALRQALSPEILHGLAELARESSPAASPAAPASRNGSGAALGKSAPTASQAAPQTDPQTDPRLAAFLAKSAHFAAAAHDLLPVPEPASSEPALTHAATPSKPTPHPSLATQLGQALHLARREKDFSTAWPSATARVVPGVKVVPHATATWASLLAYLLIRDVTPAGEGTSVFDGGQLRSALAEIFSGLGVEGEAAWRTAAYLRLLLASEDPGLALRSEAFWREGDVRWLAGVNEAAGKTYVNRELFAELLTWMQLPALLAGKLSLTEIEASMTAAQEEIAAAGYDLTAFLWSGEDEASDSGGEAEGHPEASASAPTPLPKQVPAEPEPALAQLSSASALPGKPASSKLTSGKSARGSKPGKA